MTKIKPGDKVRVLDPDRPGAKFSRTDYPAVWLDNVIGKIVTVDEVFIDYCIINRWGIHESDLELIEPKQTNNMKKTSAIFRFERQYKNENKRDLTAFVNLVIDYQHKSFTITSTRGDGFVFNYGKNFAERLAIVGCMQDAIEFAEQELKQAEG